jgi:hypothetical protein
MSVQLHMIVHVDSIVISFDRAISDADILDCARRFDRIPRIWWKHVSIILRGLDVVGSGVVELFRYIDEPAAGLTLRLMECQPSVWDALRAAGFSPCFDLPAPQALVVSPE